MSKKLKIAIYSICKNEKENIQRYIKTTQLADEVVVLDTGSTDGSFELLKQSDIKVFQKIIKP